MNPQQLPSNYLDQIAAPTTTSKFFLPGPRKLIIIGVVLTVLVLIAVAVAGMVNSSKREPWEMLVAQLSNTEKIAAEATDDIKSSQLRSLNSEIKLFITNTNRDLEAPLGLVKVDAKKLPESVTKKTAVQPTLERLETARLNAVYDRAYAREMTYQLALVLNQLKKAYAVSSSASTKTFLDTSYKSLESTHKSLSDYSAE